ncbi:BamA/TamA family outer membrane protein [Bacteroidota bacterium]
MNIFFISNISIKIHLLIFLTFHSVIALANPDQKPDSLSHIIYFTGDYGDTRVKTEYPVLKRMFEMMGQGHENSSLIMLGDIIPKKVISKDANVLESAVAGEMTTRITTILNNFKGNVFIIPGKREWELGGIKGPEAIDIKERFVERQIKKGNVFLPDHGCPGPAEIQINDDIVLLIIDTQWWLNQGIERWREIEQGCPIKEDDFLMQLQDAIFRNKGKKVIVAGHHPIMSFGPHGGYLPAYIHLTPPLFGSLYTLYRKYSGNLNDIVSLRYQFLTSALKDIFRLHDDLIYLSGHERSLQYIPDEKQHYIISGSSLKSTHVSSKNIAGYGTASKGFSRLLFLDNDDVVLEFWAVDIKTGEQDLIFTKKLFNNSENLAIDGNRISLSYQNMSIDTLASLAYGSTNPKPGLLGNNYRREWGSVIQDIPYFDFNSMHGGLKVVQRGGGMQTKSLRLEAKNRKQYVLRSIEKFPEAVVPAILRGTFAEFLVKDLISASHPYGAFAVPSLADAAGVYHTNPQLVYLPRDPALGIYQKDFANGLFLFEERPSRDWNDADFFGNSKDIVNTREVIKKTNTDNEVIVDQEHTLRSRLFDIWIGDWDRHDDQWRWASNKNKDGIKVYQPIPRDRDQAFFNSDGALLRYGTAQPPATKFQGFDYKIRNINGFAFNARHFDRAFLTQPTMDEWVSMAEELQVRLTDDVIEEGIRSLPKPIFDLSGETIIAKLKQRKIDLPDYARTYYSFLAKNVNVVGSDEKELFMVNRVDDESTRVTVYDLKNKSGKIDQIIYQRNFKTNETNEIRLYGLGEDDHFQIIGDVKKGIKVRVIGGDGNDYITDKSKVSGLLKKTLVYDTRTGNRFIPGKETRNRTSNHVDVNVYNRNDFKYNKVTPYVYFDISPDDGIFLNAEANIIKHGFRKNPYASNQTFKFSYSPARNSVKSMYSGDFIGVINKWNLLCDIDFRYPSYTDYYYGMGNETTFDEALRQTGFYHVKYMMLDLKPVLRRDFGLGKHVLGLGLHYNLFELDEDNGTERKFLEDYPNTPLEKDHHYFGPLVQYTYDIRDNNHFTHHGLLYNLEGRYTYALDEDSTDFIKIKSDLAVYLSTGGGLNTTLAFRVGGQSNIGKYQFFQANDLSGSTNLRGHRRMRFSGDHTLFLNMDIRTRFINFRMPLFPGSLGFLGFADTGRVWYENNNGNDPTAPDGYSRHWHVGYGGGIWIAPLRQYVFTFTIADSFTDDQILFKLDYGFFF